MTKAKSSSKRVKAARTQARASVGDGNVVPTLLREGPGEPHPVFYPLKKLAKMVNIGSVNLVASPRDQRSADELKGLTQELDGHGLHIDISGNVVPTL